MPDPLVVPGAPGVPGAETPGQPAWEVPGLVVGQQQQEWSAMLWDTVSWREVGTPGDRSHALGEATDWLRDGLHPGERITIASRLVGAWVLDDYGSAPATDPSPAGRPVAHTEKGERR